jgi:hypothetical protein
MRFSSAFSFCGAGGELFLSPANVLLSNLPWQNIADTKNKTATK